MAREAQQQAVAQYLQTTQQAFREVEDALIVHRPAREIRTDRARREAALRQALLLANLRYERGLSSSTCSMLNGNCSRPNWNWRRRCAISSRR